MTNDLWGLHVGMKNVIDSYVSDENSAEACGYEGMPVLGTPFLVGLLELASIFVHEYLPKPYLTVGISNEMRHLAASPIGARITITSTLITMDDRRLSFEVEAHDDLEKIACGKHVRYIVDSRRFFSKLDVKKEKLRIISEKR